MHHGLDAHAQHFIAVTTLLLARLKGKLEYSIFFSLCRVYVLLCHFCNYVNVYSVCKKLNCWGELKYSSRIPLSQVQCSVLRWLFFTDAAPRVQCLPMNSEWMNEYIWEVQFSSVCIVFPDNHAVHVIKNDYSPQHVSCCSFHLSDRHLSYRLYSCKIEKKNKPAFSDGIFLICCFPLSNIMKKKSFVIFMSWLHDKWNYRLLVFLDMKLDVRNSNQSSIMKWL